MKTKLLSIFFFVVGVTASGQQYQIDSVPNPKTENNSYVSNPDHILDDSTVTAINSMLQQLESKNGTQVAVVAITDIPDEFTIFDFSQKLFESWKIGETGKDNGLLILLVTAKHKIRFHSGFGVEAYLTDVQGKDIQRDYMLPYFKEDDYNTGMREGISQVVNILTEADYSQPSSEEDYESNDRSAFYGIAFALLFVQIFAYGGKWSSKKSKPRKGPQVKISKASWIAWYLVAPVTILVTAYLTVNYLLFFGGLYALLAIALLDKWRRTMYTATGLEKQKQFQLAYDFMNRQHKYWFWLCFLFPVPSVFFVLKSRQKISYFRDHPRKCHKCGANCEKLSEQMEDQFLSEAEKKEEELKSIDYDVWKCQSCGTVDFVIYENENSKYSWCPQCKAKAYKLDNVTTTRAATYTAEGIKKETYQCSFCQHKAVVAVSIPMLVASTSSSSDSDSSSSSSSSDSGSFGGGDSGGGGSESSW